MSNLNYGEGIYGGGLYGQGGFGVTTPVHADITATYNIKARIQASIIALYDILDIVPVTPSIPIPSIPVTSDEDLESFAKRVYGQLLPVTKDDEKLGWPLNFYIGAIGHQFQEIEDYAADSSAGDPGWSGLMDVNRIPTKGLTWLSQFVGIKLNYDDSDEGIRQQIRGHDRWGRGTPLALTSPASKYLPTNGKMYMSERNPNNYHITFIFVDEPGLGQHYSDLWSTYISYHKIRTAYATYESLYGDTPGDWDKVEALLLVGKPAALQTTFLFTTTILYLAIWILLATYQAMYDLYATYDAMYSDPFPDIGLSVPRYAQLVGARYYRNIWNQFEVYATLLDSYVTY